MFFFSPLAEVQAVIACPVQLFIYYYYIPEWLIPQVLCWQTCVWFLVFYKVQRYFARGRYCIAGTKQMDGRVAVVTGCNTGIGLETAAQLAKQGATVFMCCRNEMKGKNAMRQIRNRTPAARLEFVRLDLSDYDQVRGAAKELLLKVKEEGGGGIDLLINNAGVMDVPGALPQKLPVNGHECHIGTNHLGTVLFTELIKHAVLAKRDGRIVIVASQAQRAVGKSTAPGALYQKFLRHDQQITSKQFFMVPYGISKACNVIYACHLAKLHSDNGSHSNGFIATSLHPGVVSSDLVRSPVLQLAMKLFIAPFFFKNVVDGAQTTLACALEGGIETGGYYCDCILHNDRPPAPVNDAHSSEQIMEWSLKQVGLTATSMTPGISATEGKK